MASTKKSTEENVKKKKGRAETQKQKKPATKHALQNGNSSLKDKTKREEEEEEAEELEDDVILVLSSSASESHETIEIEGDDEGGGGEDEAEAEEVKKKAKKKGNTGDGEDEEGGGGEDGTMCRFPMARIKRIMKAEESTLQVGRDVVFLVNKAAEKFLEQFCEEAYDAMGRDCKKSLAYKHLASVVKEEERYDFLRDYVPEKMTAEDALAERNLAETS